MYFFCILLCFARLERDGDIKEMESQHETRQAAREKENCQQQDDSHFVVAVAHDHQRHQQNIHGDADRRQQIFGHEHIFERTVRQNQSHDDAHREKTTNDQPVYFGDKRLQFTQLH